MARMQRLFSNDQEAVSQQSSENSNFNKLVEVFARDHFKLTMINFITITFSPHKFVTREKFSRDQKHFTRGHRRKIFPCQNRRQEKPSVTAIRLISWHAM